MSILERINSSNDIKKLPEEELEPLCQELRDYMISSISRTGGHLASNLGAVELTVALHRVYDTSRDRVVFDVGHQSYVHKIITGRRDSCWTLRQHGGLYGFPKPYESEDDAFIAGHASNSVSVALGMARARTLSHADYDVAAIIGDGALSGGLAYEGLANAAASGEPLVVILNDNNMSINENVGGTAHLLESLRVRPGYISFKRWYRDVFAQTEVAFSKLSGKDVYTPMLTGIDNWITVHGAEWITQMSDEAKEAVSSMIRYSAKGNIGVDELARIIRPTIGLTEPQSLANAHYYESCRERLKKQLMEKYPTMKEATAEKQAAKRARESALRYAGRQHRERAQMIAETELAYAYNKGADDAIHQAQDAGLMPRMRAKWSTAADEGVCGICASLDGVEIDLGDSFDYKGKSLYGGQKQTPPAHPRCRCALCYVEVDE